MLPQTQTFYLNDQSSCLVIPEGQVLFSYFLSQAPTIFSDMPLWYTSAVSITLPPNSA